MDFIGQLASQLGVNEDAAKAIAGTALGSVQSAVKEDAGDDAAGEIASAVPELGGWQAKATEVLSQGDGDGGGGLLGGLLGGGGGDLLSSVAGAVGGEKARQTTQLIALLGKLGIEPSHATMVAPIALNFLKERLSPEILDTALKAAPALLGAAGGGSEEGEDSGPGIGDLVGGLGGLFGK